MRMLISKTPVRLSMGGGGTDLASYYEKHSGFFTSAAINLYVRVTVNSRHDNNYVIKYSDKTERVSSISEIEHELIRATVNHMRMDQWKHPLFKTSGLEINVISDVPTRSGLGVSGAMTVGLLQILYTLIGGTSLNKLDLAEEAYKIEHDLPSGSSTGKQDQYIAAFGGIKSFEIDRAGKVTVIDLELSRHARAELESNLVLFGTRLERTQTANEALREAVQGTGSMTVEEKEAKRSKAEEYLTKIKAIGLRQQEALLRDQPDEFGRLLDDHWQIKIQYSGDPDPIVADAYQQAMQAGSLGGKVIGASTQGAFMIFYCPDNRSILREIMDRVGMSEIPWFFEDSGSHIGYID